jgi:hypothetical protein
LPLAKFKNREAAERHQMSALDHWLSGRRSAALLAAPNQVPFEMPLEREEVTMGAAAKARP